MKYIDIHSIPNIQQEYNQDMHMFLTHLVYKYPEYCHVAKECEGFKILDNSLIEMGSAMDPSLVIEAAKMIGANEVVLPDVFQMSSSTCAAIEAAIPEFKREVPWCQRMAVVQGIDQKSWLECLDFIVNNDDIDTIGIPKVCAKMHPEGRRWFVEKVINSGTTKKIHLLGLWYGYDEFRYWDNALFGYIRSVDTIMEEYIDATNSRIRPDGWTIDLETGKVVKSR